ncbi:MAG: hypothetical protein HY303_02040 [Candidatus Wallbacteria bacterium]|nr:hypothetical protein [Candidatus Wallbacteria bacterium]
MEAGSESIICRVCGDELGTEAVVACRSCGTPHHKDCWDFTNLCSVYGCGENRFVAFARQEPLEAGHIGRPEEVLAIDEDTPIPAAYARRRDLFPSPTYFAVLAYNNSITGLKLFGTGLFIWVTSWMLSKVIQPFLFFSVAGSVLLLLAPIYWIAASVLGIIAVATGLVEGRVERKAVYGCLVGSFVPILVSLYADLGPLVLGGAAMLFAGSFFFQLLRNAVHEKFGQ